MVPAAMVYHHTCMERGGRGVDQESRAGYVHLEAASVECAWRVLLVLEPVIEPVIETVIEPGPGARAA